MIVDKCRSLKEFYKLYNDCNYKRIHNAEDILSLSTYRCFYDKKDGSLVGCIYLEDEEGKTMLSGFGRRKSFNLIVEAIQYILWLNPKIDIYSRTDKLSAKFALREAGFKKCDNRDNELYIRKAAI